MSPPAPFSNPWQRWAEMANREISPQRRPLSAIHAIQAAAAAIDAPIPSSVAWTNRIQLTGHGHGDLQGSLLEFMASIGDMGAYAHCDHSPGIAEALARLGELLVSKGAKPTPGLVSTALRIGLLNLDGPDRLEACVRWGALDCMDGADALATCARVGSWDKKGGAACWDRLVELGAMAGPQDWKTCHQSQQPLVAALKTRDFDAFKRGLAAGVSAEWTDPKSGATLWHLACGGGTAIAKAIAPLLAKHAPSLANARATGADNFDDDHAVSVGPGQSALHLAASKTELFAVKILLSLGADPNALDAKGNTPLHLLARKHGAKAQAKALPVVEALIAAGANPGLATPDGRTAAQIMAAKAPLGALEKLLELRPEDIASDDARSKKALASLSARGAAETSLAERVVFDTLATTAATPSKKKSRL